MATLINVLLAPAGHRYEITINTRKSICPVVATTSEIS